MKIKEAAEFLGISERAIYKQIKQERGIGRFFYRNNRGKLVIDEKYVIDEKEGAE